MTGKDRNQILDANLKTIIDYGLLLFFGESESVLGKLEAAYMIICRVPIYMISKETKCKVISLK